MKSCGIIGENNTLSFKKIGEVFVVAQFKNTIDTKYLRRLMEIGLTIGTSIRLLKKSIRGKTLLVEIRGVVYSMQKEIASQIIVK